MRLKYLLYLFAFMMISLSVQASETNSDINWDNTEQNVFVNVYPAKNSIEPGESVPLILEQVIRPHWHTYWQNPGDSGEVMKANWTLPEGFSVSEISWPAPIKLPFDPLLNYGFEGTVQALQTITAPANLAEGNINIPVRFDILVCKEICIPESVEASISFNTETTSQNLATEDMLSNVRASFPIAADTHNWGTKLSEKDGNLYLDIQTDIAAEKLQNHEVEFFSYEYGLIQYPAPTDVTIDGSRIVLKQARGDFALDNIKNIGGVLVLEHKQKAVRDSYQLAPDVVKDAPVLSEKKTESTTSEINADLSLISEDISLFKALVFALIGGLILNLMPCVFPVLSMKALSLSKISEKSKSEAQKHGLAYTAGVILSFLVIAGLLIILKSGGNEIGWGFHLQNPVVILLLAYLFFAIGLNLSGLFEIGGKLMSIGQGRKTEGVSGSFMTGILATLVATPCTAPFMAGAIGYAFLQTTPVTLMIFVALSLGLALPYLLISFIPRLHKIMPKPGQWMVTFKEFLAFPMYATVIWLLWILSNQIGMNGIATPLIGLLSIAFAIWLYKRGKLSQGGKKALLVIAALGVFGGSMLYTIYQIQMFEISKEKPMPKFGEAYSPAVLEEALQTDQPVFVEMTAAWCVTCKVNHYRAIDIPQTKEIIERRDVRYLIGDWTNYNAEITQYLNKFGRNGVPIYIYYGRPDPDTGARPEPQMLPQILSPSIVAKALDR